ncbi:unannotated protein [freshwater metagenome]|uniref:Unannotated protein n=1 Tax=freshwater metagenome TaxID=449393 RepID=A0A6J7HDD8_9ZZZZ|nr:hypothetical protein [Actinomycetota bacterium]
MDSSKQQLALAAALLPSDQAKIKWDCLREISTIEELDHSVTRILPSVYRNLKDFLTGNDLLKLRGSAKHTWAKNSEFLNQLKPLIETLNNNSISYRVLKGGAINLLYPPANFRIMGDIDLLISRKDLGRVQEILEQCDFTPKFSYSCPHTDKKIRKLELDYSHKGSLEIDLHVAEDRAPRSLFKSMMTRPPRVVYFSGTPVSIPDDDLLIAHSLIHGSLNVDSSDRAQTILDVFLLLKNSNIQKVTATVQSLRIDKILESYYSTVENIFEKTDKQKVTKKKNYFLQLYFLLSNVNFSFNKLSKILRAVKYRSPSPRYLVKILRYFNGKSLLYVLWLYTGMIRPVERFVVKRLGGFVALTIPTSSVESKPKSPTYRWTNDWRFSFNNLAGHSRHIILFNSVAFKSQSFLVFANGKLIGVTAKNDLSQFKFDFHEPAKQIEISLRLPLSGCKKCALALSDLGVKFLEV